MATELQEKAPTVLLLSRLQPASGNNSTMNRICCHFEASSWRPVSVDTDSIKCTEDLRNLVKKYNVRFGIGLHAYHAGQWLRDLGYPYSLIFGGTDLNEYSKDPSKLKVMKQAVYMARFLVAFSEHMSDQADALWPGCSTSNRLKVIHQGVITSVSPHLEVCIHNRYGLPEGSDIIVMVGAVRPVKDQLYLLDAFTAWYRTCDKPVYLAIIGPLMDKEYGQTVLNKVESCPGVLYLGSYSLQDAHCLIQKSLALVNSSLSEGQATAVLEAQTMGTPVIVRDIPGNLAIVEHGNTGLIFSSPQDFIHQLEYLLRDDKLRRHLATNAVSYVNSNHSFQREKAKYLLLVSEMQKGSQLDMS